MRAPDDDTTLYEILQHHERCVRPSDVTRALLGESFTPTHALLCSLCPAGGEWSTDWRLWIEFLEKRGLPRETIAVFEAAVLTPSVGIVARVRSLIRTTDGRERCDYYGAILGDKASIRRLYDRYHDASDLRSAFVMGLRIRGEKPRDKLHWRRGVEAQVLLHGVEHLQNRHAAQARVLDALTVFENATSGGTGIDPRHQYEGYVVDAILKADPLRRQTKRTAGVQPVEADDKVEVADTRPAATDRVAAIESIALKKTSLLPA